MQVHLHRCTPLAENACVIISARARIALPVMARTHWRIFLQALCVMSSAKVVKQALSGVFSSTSVLVYALRLVGESGGITTSWLNHNFVSISSLTIEQKLSRLVCRDSGTRGRGLYIPGSKHIKCTCTVIHPEPCSKATETLFQGETHPPHFIEHRIDLSAAVTRLTSQLLTPASTVALLKTVD